VLFDFRIRFCGGLGSSSQYSLAVARYPAARGVPASNRSADKSFGVFHENHRDTQLWEQAAHLLQCPYGIV